MPASAQHTISFSESAAGGLRNQATLAKPASLKGVSLFHGVPSNVRLLPADQDTGIVFQRTDLADSAAIPASWRSVQPTPRRTVLKSATGATVETVEHLLAAMAGMGIDNCVVEIDAPETPSFDGSARAWCDAILDAGVCLLSAPVKIAEATGVDYIQSRDLKQSLNLRPYLKSLTAVTYHLDYGPGAVIPPQVHSVEVTPEYFYEEISQARTFVLESEISALRSMGYGRHLTPDDLLVFGPTGVIGNSLRWEDECARHKILDCIGDLSLCGHVVCGHVTAHRSGHQLNHQLARRVEENNVVQRAPLAA